MFKEMIDTGSALKDAEQASNINERAKYTAITAMALISTANVNIDGTGTITSLFTAGSNGTLIKKINIQAITNVTKGMIRFWIYNPFSLTYYLIDEVDVPAVLKSATQDAFSVTYEVDYFFQSALSFCVSTQNGESFAVTIEGLEFSY
jgi:hypothetical protein